MTRRILLVAAWLGCVWPGTIALGSPGSDIISEPAAQQHGLTRAWYTQVQVDPSRGRIRELILDEGTLFLLSDQSMLTAIDATTGSARWSVEVGNRRYPSLTPAANRKFVAVVNGSTLYVLNRYNGKLLWQTSSTACAGAGPRAESAAGLRAAARRPIGGLPYEGSQGPAPRSCEERDTSPPEQQAAYDTARLESLRLEQDVQTPLFCQCRAEPWFSRWSRGRTRPKRTWFGPPTRDSSARAGSIASNKALELRYRLQTDAPIVAQPAYLPPDANVVPDSGVLIAGSEDGFVYGIRERTGDTLWRFSTGEPIVEDPVLLGRFVFVTNQLGGMYCVDAKIGHPGLVDPRSHSLHRRQQRTRLRHRQDRAAPRAEREDGLGTRHNRGRVPSHQAHQSGERPALPGQHDGHDSVSPRAEPGRCPAAGPPHPSQGNRGPRPIEDGQGGCPREVLRRRSPEPSGRPQAVERWRPAGGSKSAGAPEAQRLPRPATKTAVPREEGGDIGGAAGGKRSKKAKGGQSTPEHSRGHDAR